MLKQVLKNSKQVNYSEVITAIEIKCGLAFRLLVRCFPHPLLLRRQSRRPSAFNPARRLNSALQVHSNHRKEKDLPESEALVARPACIAGVLVTFPNFSELWRRTKFW